MLGRLQRIMLSLALLAALATASSAQDPRKNDKSRPPDPPARTGPTAEQMVDSILARLDVNKDGKISRSEARGPIADNFDLIDTNKDGYLDRKELQAMARRRLAAMAGGMRPASGGAAPGTRSDPLDFDALDKNADGRLTRDELKGTPWFDLFEAIDRNHDGKIDPQEWEAYHKSRK
jgi:Ca2+-binding EF-hand superfamily protein